MYFHPNSFLCISLYLYSTSVCMSLWWDLSLFFCSCFLFYMPLLREVTNHWGTLPLFCVSFASLRHSLRSPGVLFLLKIMLFQSTIHIFFDFTFSWLEYVWFKFDIKFTYTLLNLHLGGKFNDILMNG